MSEDYSQTEAKLAKLSKRLHQGWAKLHPATDKDLAAVREIVTQHWKADQEISRRIAESRRAKQSATTKTKAKQKRKSKGAKSRSQKPPNRSQSHEHGH